jgi:Na+/alanine symporter
MMRRAYLGIVAFLFSTGSLFAQESGKIDQAINSFMEPITNWVFKFVFVGVELEDWDGNPIPNADGSAMELPLILLWLVGAALIFTVLFKFANIRCLPLAFRTVKGKYSRDDDPGEITHFQALSAALSATVGLGNIAGVAIAVSLGGAGAVFWMVVVGFLGMTSKFCECTLGVKYRTIQNGKVFGGPMYYLRDGLAERDMKGLGKVLSVLFAIMCVGAAFGGGNMFQANQSCQQLVGVTSSEDHLLAKKELESVKKDQAALNQITASIAALEEDAVQLEKDVAASPRFAWQNENLDEQLAETRVLLTTEREVLSENEDRFGDLDDRMAAAEARVSETEGFLGRQRWIFGVGLAVLVGLVIIGGIQGIAKVTSKLVPIMTAVYIVSCATVLLANFADVPAAFGHIVKEAFVPNAIAGGFIGAFIQGIRRAAFSNEAGFGSAPIAHAAVKTRKPASEGLVALLEPLMDTIVVCTMTGLAIVVTAPDHNYIAAGGGIALTSSAFETVVPAFQYVLLACVILFAFSTLISWSYYGQQAWAFLFGKSKGMEMLYKVIFCIFVVIGASLSLGSVLDFSDGMLFAMSLFNLIGVYLLLPVVRREFDIFKAFAKRIDEGASVHDADEAES